MREFFALFVMIVVFATWLISLPIKLATWLLDVANGDIKL